MPSTLIVKRLCFLLFKEMTPTESASRSLSIPGKNELLLSVFFLKLFSLIYGALH